MSLTPVDWDIIDARVNSVSANRFLRTKSLAFLYLVLEQFFPAKSHEITELITDGSNDRGIDAIEIIESENQAEVFLFQSKYREKIESTTKTINEIEVQKIISFLRELFNQSKSLENSGNLALDESVKRIWRLHRRGYICTYKIIFCSNGQGLSLQARELLEAAIAEYSSIKYESYQASDLIRDLSQRNRKPENGQLAVVAKDIFERTDGDIRGCIASVDATSFIELIRTQDGRAIKRQLFEENLRVFLGENGGYNAEIIATAKSPDKHLF